MQTSDFSYELPAELIAQHPLAGRSDSRLLHLGRHSGQVQHSQFKALPGFLQANDLLVFNNTRVIPARLYGRKQSGGGVEVLVERLLDERRCLAQLRVSKKPPAGSQLLLEGGAQWQVLGRQGDFFELQTASASISADLEAHGHIPLPPYIQRDDAAADRERYQTVYAAEAGAVAAPTAGLHFDEGLLAALQEKGVRSAFVTLHVGAGTFQPVRAENIEEHRMHAEYLRVSEQVCAAVAETRERNGRVVAVGTTSVRSLETAAAGGQLAPYAGDSRLFIYPGYEYRVVDAMITNFHLPESTLLMLVSAFAGLQPVLNAYRQAVQERYRFFSYGDAMFIS
jgi:S-adenosylmethionine:tRNA ribosyltransferase-isomerase